MVLASMIVPPQKYPNPAVGLPWRKCTCHGIGDGAVFPLTIRVDGSLLARSNFIHDGIFTHSLLA